MAVQINVAANQAALTASIQAGVQAYNQKFAQNNQINLSINQRAFSQPLGRITGDVKDFEAALAASNARVIAFGASTAVLGGVIRGFKELATVTIEVEKNLADINRVFGLTTNQLQKFSIELFNVSKTTATSFNEASKAALEFSRQGLKAEDTLQRTKDALTLTRLAGISTANAVDALTSTVNGFASTGVTTTQILNKLVAVEQDYAVGAGDLAEALSRTGQAAQEAGVSLDQLNALVTSAQQSTARGGAVIGNALKTIFTRLQRTETLDQLEAFKIAVRDVQGNILPAVQILQNFAGAYKGLADAQRAQLSEQVAGVYQVNILKAIVNDLNKSQGVYAGALQRGASATNEAEIATAKLNKTLDALLTQTGIATQQLATNIGKVTFEPLAKYGTEQLKSFIESINDLLEGEGIGSTFANGFLKGIRNIIAGPGAIAAFFTLFKLIQNSFSYLTQALPQIAGITTETQNRKNIEASILQILQQQGPISQALAGTMGNQAAQAQLLLQLAKQQTAEYQQQTALAKNLAATLSTQGVAVKGGRGLQVTRAGGYIPNATRMAEVVGAQAGGYAPGRVVSSPVGGVMNTAEDVKYIPGFAQPFINPPANSKAGRAHRQNAINRTGVDPYMYGGFIPNFSKSKYFDKQGDSLILKGTRSQPLLVPDAEELSTVSDPLLDKVFGLEYKIVLAGSKSKFENSFDRKMNDVQQAKNLLIFSSLEGNEKDVFIKNYSKYKQNKSDFKVSPFKANKKQTVDFSDQLRGVKNDVLGNLYELYLEKKFGLTRNIDQTAISNLDFIGAEAKFGGFTGANLLSKAIRNNAEQTYKNKNYYANKRKNNIDLNNQVLTLYTTNASGGFIPNFAPPTSAIRIPWFKKFGNPAFDAIQPALGISKASDIDTFRQVNFKSSAKGADKVGDNNIFAPLYEDFVFKAMQLVSQSKIKDQLIRGYALQPGTDQKQSAFDAFLGDVALEYKGFPKANLTGSISGNLNDKYERFAKANPTGAAKIKESIITFNELGHENQLPSAFGKTFSELAGTSYSQMAKSSPDLVKGLSAETNNLLNSYVKNPAFLAMTAASGFIPNFAYKQAVMGLEESMSGNKAIFDTKPFPHIRNSSQPTFSSAIADHGGLGNALSDSMRGQKAAGLMSGGFIPNFADFSSIGTSIRGRSGRIVSRKSIDAAINSYIKSIDLLKVNNVEINKQVQKLLKQYNLQGISMQELLKQVKAHADAERAAAKNVQTSSQNTGKFKERFTKFTTGAMFAGPLIAGQLEQAYFGNKERSELSSTERMAQSAVSTGLTSVTTGASIGNMIFPGLGGAVGAAVGGLIGLTSALDASKLSFEELNNLNTKQIENLRQNASAAGSYIEKQKNLSELITSKADETQISNAMKDLKNSFSEIKDVNLAKSFLDAGTDVKKLTKALSDYQQSIKRRSSADAAISALREGGFFTSTAEKGVKNPRDVAFNLFNAFSESASGKENLNKIFASKQKIETLRLGNKGKASRAVSAEIGNIQSQAVDFIVPLVKEAYPELVQESEEFKQTALGFANLFFGKSGLLIKQAYEELTLAQEKASEGLDANMAVIAYLSSTRENLEKTILDGLFEANESLKSSETGRKISEEINNFQISLQENFLNPLVVSASKMQFQKNKIESEFKDSQTKIGLKFIETNLSSLLSLTESAQTLTDVINPAIAKAYSGDFSDIEKIISGQTEGLDPKKLQSLRKANADRLREISAEEKSRNRSISLVENQKRLDDYKSNSLILESQIIKDEIALVAQRERLEQTRKNNLDLEIDAIERRQADEAQYFGMGVIGKAQGKANFRNQILEKRLLDTEISRSKSAQSDYDEIIKVRKNNILNEADILESQNRTDEAITLRQTAQSYNGTQITDLQSLQQAISDLESRSFANPKQEEQRERALQKLKNIQSDINEGKIKEIELNKRLNEQELIAAKRSTSFRYGFAKGFDNLKTESELMIGRLGEDLPRMFGDGLVDGIKAAIRESDNLGEALLGVASKFLDEISTTLMRAGIYQILGSFGTSIPGIQMAAAGRQKGGIIRAQSGMYISGTGSGDKYPALLENGEYVLNRKAVMAMGGPAELDKLNFSMAPRFASGGSFSNKFEDISSMEANMTTFGLEESKLYNELRDVKRQEAEDARQKKRARRQQMAGLVGSVVAGVVTAGIGAGISNKMQNVQAGKAMNLSAKLQTGQPLTNAESLSIRPLMDKGLISPTGLYTGPSVVRTGFSGFTGYGGRQIGGSIGSRLSDTIPGYATGGLFETPIVKRYAIGGGASGSGFAGATAASNNMINNNTNANNSFSFNTTVSRDNKIEIGANTTSYAQQDIELSQNLNSRIYETVLETIRNEKRFGGSLAGVRNR